MAATAMLKVRKIAISLQRMDRNFDEIWQSDATELSRHHQLIIFRELKIQDGGGRHRGKSINCIIFTTN